MSKRAREYKSVAEMGDASNSSTLHKKQKRVSGSDDDDDDGGETDSDYEVDLEAYSSSDSDNDINEDEKKLVRRYDAKHKKTKHGYEKDGFVTDGDDDGDDEKAEEDVPSFIIHNLFGGVPHPKKKRKSKEGVNLFESTNARLDEYTDEEFQYYQSVPEAQRKAIAELENEVNVHQSNSTPMRFKILQSGMDSYTKGMCLSKLAMINRSEDRGSEHIKYTQWLNTVCAIPFGNVRELPVNHASPRAEISAFLQNVRTKLNGAVYGHTKSKDQFLRVIAQWISSPNYRGNVIGIHGHPGVGKTSLVKEGICKALDIPFGFIPLGGANDGSYLDGHGFTYEGSTWGRIVDVLMKSKCMNPVLYFDELDKISGTTHGDEVVNVLIHLTDPAQNDRFHDKYVGDVPIDLSKAVIIFTYNDDSSINPILKDRMLRIEVDSYKVDDKVNIVLNYIAPTIRRDYNITEQEIPLDREIVQEMISACGSEHGVRNLKRMVEYIFSTYNLGRFDTAMLPKNSTDENHNLTRAGIKELMRWYSSTCGPKLVSESIHQLYT